MKIIVKSFLSLLLIWVVGCDTTTSPEKIYESNVYQYKVLERNQDPYAYKTTASTEVNYPVDSSGVMMFNINGELYYHPVNMTQWMLYFLDSYKQTGIQNYLNRTELFADKMMELAIDYRGAKYFSYDFDIFAHGYKDSPLNAPWYSGMAQGLALSLFSRLYIETHNEKYLSFASLILNSFKNLRTADDELYTAFIDENNYYWIEEYPLDIPDRVLNGFIFAIYGLYDYYMLTNDAECKELLDASITTIERYLPEYRNEGGSSCYCLRHKHVDPHYHTIHFDQLITLYNMTGEMSLLQMAMQFYSDYH